MLVKVEELTADLSQVRLFHTSVSRAIATLADLAGRARLHRRLRRVPRPDVPDLDRRRLRHPRGRHRQRGDLRRAGPVLGDRPPARCSSTSSRPTSPTSLLVGMPDDRRVPAPVPRPRLADAARTAQPNPAYDDVDLNGVAGRPRRRSARRFIRERLPGVPTTTLTLARSADRRATRRRSSSSDHGFAPQFLAIDASKVARRPRAAVDAADVELPARHRRDDRQGEGLLGRRRRADLPQPRRPRPGRRRLHAGRRRPTQRRRSPRSRPRSWASPTRTTGPRDGQPEGWKVIDRVFTKAEARYIPNGPGTHGRHGPPDAHRRPRRVLLPAVPVRRRDAGHADRAVALLRPARLRAGRPGPRRQRQHAGDVPRRRPGHRQGPGRRARTIDLAPTLAYLLGIPSRSTARAGCCSSVAQGRHADHADLDHRAQRLPRPARPDDAGRSTARSTCPSAARRYLATMFDEELASLPRPGPAPRRRRQRRRLAAELGAARGHAGDRRRERLGPRRHVATATTSSTTASSGCSSTRRAPTSRSSPRTSSRTATGEAPAVGARRRRCSPSTASRSASSAPSCKNTPELVSAGATAGLTFLDEAPRIKAESERLRRPGRQGPGRRDPPGHGDRRRTRSATPPACRGTARSSASPTQLQDTTVDAMIVGHTHRVSNLMRGNILVTEGINAGASYSVLQLMVQGGDVAWAGGATRVAKTIGVAPRAGRPGDRRRRQRRRRPCCATRSSAPRRSTSRATRPGSTSRRWATWSPTRCGEKYPGVDAALTNSGGLRADLVCTPPSAGEQPGEITWGEMFAVLPFGNRTVILTLTGAQLQTGVPQRLHARSATRLHRRPAGSRRSPASRSSSTATGRRRSSTACGRRPTDRAGR